jgi:hypothetical protein
LFINDYIFKINANIYRVYSLRANIPGEKHEPVQGRRSKWAVGLYVLHKNKKNQAATHNVTA